MSKSKEISPNQIVDALNWRYAVKIFDSSRKVPEPVVQSLLESVRLTATSYGLQPMQVIVVTDEETKQKLKPASFDQDQIDTASHLVVFACKEKMDEAYIARYIDLISETHEVERPTLAKFEKVMIDDKIKKATPEANHAWASKQAYIAMGTLMTAAALLGVDSCPMEGIEPKKYDEILGLQGTGFRTVMLVALGYRSTKDRMQHKKKVRLPHEKFFRKI